MLFSLFAGWQIRRIWPSGIVVVIFISAVAAMIGYYRSESLNAQRALLREAMLPNSVNVVFVGFVIDVAINFVLFLIAWGLRRKIRPHAQFPD